MSKEVTYTTHSKQQIKDLVTLQDLHLNMVDHHHQDVTTLKERRHVNIILTEDQGGPSPPLEGTCKGWLQTSYAFAASSQDISGQHVHSARPTGGRLLETK
jgi:hypothetical protein